MASNFPDRPSTTDLSHLGAGLNPFGESMSNGNTTADKGPFQAQGTDSEGSHDLPHYDASEQFHGAENVKRNEAE